MCIGNNKLATAEEFVVEGLKRLLGGLGKCRRSGLG